jgi:hypothetical protein
MSNGEAGEPGPQVSQVLIEFLLGYEKIKEVRELELAFLESSLQAKRYH